MNRHHTQPQEPSTPATAAGGIGTTPSGDARLPAVSTTEGERIAAKLASPPLTAEAIAGYLEASRGVHYWEPQDDEQWAQTLALWRKALEDVPGAFADEAFTYVLSTSRNRPSPASVKLRAELLIKDASRNRKMAEGLPLHTDPRHEEEMEQIARNRATWTPASEAAAMFRVEEFLRRHGRIAGVSSLPPVPWQITRTSLERTMEDHDIADLIAKQGLPHSIDSFRRLHGIPSLTDRRIARTQIVHSGGVRGWIARHRKGSAKAERGTA